MSIADIVEEMRRALLALWRRYGKRMLVLGHSAGGHLTAAMLATDWPALDATAPADLVPAGYAISGVFDLVPLVQVSMNRDFRLDDDAREKSRRCCGRRRAAACSMPWWARSNRTNSCARAASSRTSGARPALATRYEEIAGTNHFTVLDPLTDPDSAMVARLLAMMPR